MNHLCELADRIIEGPNDRSCFGVRVTVDLSCVGSAWKRLAMALEMSAIVARNSAGDSTEGTIIT